MKLTKAFHGARDVLKVSMEMTARNGVPIPAKTTNVTKQQVPVIVVRKGGTAARVNVKATVENMAAMAVEFVASVTRGTGVRTV